MDQYDCAPSFLEMRDNFFKLAPNAIAEDDGENPTALALLMEMGLPTGLAALMAAADGSASIYFSAGGGIIGGREHAAIRNAAHNMVRIAPEYLPLMSRTEEFPLTCQGSIRFYVLTPAGVYTTEAEQGELTGEEHILAELFVAANQLIAEIRAADEQTP